MSENLLPDVNRRIKEIIDVSCNGNIRQFSMNMGLKDSSKINRLFNIEKRTGRYPMPSVDIILLISNTYGYSTDYLLKGSINKEKHVNNITIDANKLKGDNNIISSNSTISQNNPNDYIETLKMQQQTINNLLNVLNNK